ILTDLVHGRRGGKRLDGGAIVFGIGEKKFFISMKAKKKKPLNSLGRLSDPTFAIQLRLILKTWWDDAVMEEMRDFQTEMRRLKEAVAEREQKLLLLEKTVYDAGKDTAQVKLIVCLLVVIGLVILVLHVKFSTYLDFIFSLCVCIKTFDCLMSSFKGFNGECSITCPMAKKVKSIFTAMSGYRHLLYSQMPVDLESPEPFWLGSQAPDDSPSEIPPECPSQIPPECPSQVPGQSRRQSREDRSSLANAELSRVDLEY
ncbi:hypothetical protein HID58_051609, partial [Brassica napus]